MAQNDVDLKSDLGEEDEIKDDLERDFEDFEEDENENEDGQALTLEEYYANHGGDPKKLDLSRTVLVTNLPSEFIEDEYKLFNEAIQDMLLCDFKVSREAIDHVIRVPKLNKEATDQENALMVLVSFKSKVHKHRMIAKKKLAEEKSALSLSTVEEIPRDWFDVDSFGLDEVVEEEDEEKSIKTVDSQKKRERTKEESESMKEKEKREKEEFHKRYAEDDDGDTAFTTDWDGAPEFQWKLCQSKFDNRKIILDNIHFSDLRDPFLYRAIVKAESTKIEFPQRYSFDGLKSQKGRITLTFTRDVYLMSTAMRSLIYIRSPNKRRIKIYLPQHEITLEAKDEFEKKLGRVIEQTDAMRQLVIKVLPLECIPTIEKGIEWFPGFNVSAVEHKTDGRGQPVALVTFASTLEAMDAHSSTPFVTIDDQKCQVFLMSMEVNKLFLSVFDKAVEKEAFRAKQDRKYEDERKDRDKLKIRASSTYKRKTEPIPYSDKRGRWEPSRSRAPRGFRASFRGTRGFRGGPRLTSSSRTVDRAPISRYESSSTFVRRGGYRGSNDRYRETTSGNSFETSGRSFNGHHAHESGSSYGTVSQSAFDYSRPSTNYFSPEKRRTYY